MLLTGDTLFETLDEVDSLPWSQSVFLELRQHLIFTYNIVSNLFSVLKIVNKKSFAIEL